MMLSTAKVPLVIFSVDRTARAGLQKQIQTAIVEGIHSGKIPAGAKLPSIRSLAEHLDVSRITVSQVYGELTSIGYLVAKDRSGYFAAKRKDNVPKFATKATSAHKPNFSRRFAASEIRLRRPADWRSYPFCFIYGQADPTLIDHYRWRQCSLEALGRRDFDTLALDSYEHDDPLLIKYLVTMNLPRRGIYADESQILITMGALNALWLTTELFLDAQKTAILENPCYPSLRSMLLNQDCKLETVDVDAKGLNPEQIPTNVDLVFTTPSHQCPTNVTMPKERRIALIERAERDGFMIVEDDYEFENQLHTSPTPALKSFDQNGRVIYTGSFSKSLFPGLRMGYMVASPEIIREARALRSMVTRNPSSHAQRTVAYFQSLGYYDRQLRKMARVFDERRVAMIRAINKYGLEYSGDATAGGSSFWMKTHPRINTIVLAERLLKRGVLIEAGAPFFEPDTLRTNHYRLGFSSISPKRIDAGIALIREEIDKY